MPLSAVLEAAAEGPLQLAPTPEPEGPGGFMAVEEAAAGAQTQATPPVRAAPAGAPQS